MLQCVRHGCLYAAVCALTKACPCRAAAAHQWERDDWDEPGPMGPSSRRPSESSLPLHEAWMQHEAEWAQLNRVRVTSTSFTFT